MLYYYIFEFQEPFFYLRCVCKRFFFYVMHHDSTYRQFFSKFYLSRLLCFNEEKIHGSYIKAAKRTYKTEFATNKSNLR